MSEVQPQPHKTKRVRLTVEKKLEIIGKLESGTTVPEIMAEYAISRTQVYDIRAAKQELREYSYKIGACASTWEKKRALSRLTLRNPKFASVDEAVFGWYIRRRSMGVAVKGVELKAAAARMAAALGVKGFRASSGWLQRFTNRNITKNRQTGPDRHDVKSISRFVNKFRQLYRENNLQDYQLYNADETLLKWKAFPNNTHAFKWDSGRPRHKMMESHVSVLMCVNADGSHRLKLMVTGKGYTCRDLRPFMDRLPVYWQDDKTWSMQEMFKTWFMCVFVPAVVDFQVNQKGIRDKDVKALLIYDDDPAHPAPECLASSDGKIKCMRLPGSASSILQPLEQNIGLACKRRYRRIMLDECLVVDPEAQEESHSRRCLQAFKNYNLYDALINLRRGWEAISTRTLVDAWKMLFGHLPQHGLLSCDFDDFTVAECVSLFHTAGEKEVREDDVVQWLVVDDGEAAHPSQTEELPAGGPAATSHIRDTSLDSDQKEDTVEVRPLKLSRVRDNIDEVLAFLIATEEGDLLPFYDDLKHLRTFVVRQQQRMFDPIQKNMKEWLTPKASSSPRHGEGLLSAVDPVGGAKATDKACSSYSEIPAVFVECAESEESEFLYDEDMDLKVEIKEEVVDDTPEFLAMIADQVDTVKDPKEDTMDVFTVAEPSISSASTSASREKVSPPIPQVEDADEFHLFGMFVASQLRALPLRDALQAQLEIQTMLAQKRSQRLT